MIVDEAGVTCCLRGSRPREARGVLFLELEDHGHAGEVEPGTEELSNAPEPIDVIRAVAEGAAGGAVGSAVFTHILSRLELAVLGATGRFPPAAFRRLLGEQRIMAGLRLSRRWLSDDHMTEVASPWLF